MITILLGTNRPLSKTAEIGKIYNKFLNELNVPHQILTLEGKNFFTRNEEMISIENEYLIPAEKYIFILPEYNGSFPGVLKLLIDNADIKKAWWYKKALLVGLADGRGGNLRGLDHLTSILHYLKVNVFYHKVIISKVNQMLDTNAQTLEANLEKEIQEQISGFMNF